jgi:hypothetical protein
VRILLRHMGARILQSGGWWFLASGAVFVILSGIPASNNALAGSLASAPSHGASISLPASGPADNRIVQENQLPGTDSWQAPGVYNGTHLAAYTSSASVNAGQPVDIYINNTQGGLLHLTLYRLGYYQGHGARLVATYPAISPGPQPACLRDATTGLVSCPWIRSFTIYTNPNWVSGIFLLRIDAAHGLLALTYFVVRNDAYAAPIVAQDASTTNQAYNLFGGESLYHSLNHEGRARAYEVSYDRPYDSGDGAGTLFSWEFDMVRWLEGSGYDVSYVSDIDVATNPAILRTHRVFLDMGHDEYWSGAERTSLAAARDAGVNLVFATGDTGYWNVRLASSFLGPNRVIICYKDANLDPEPTVPNVTVNFDGPFLNLPENSLLGIEYRGGDPLAGEPPWVVVAPGSRWYFDCTGLKPGTVINNIIGYEWDTLANNGAAPAGLETIASSSMPYGRVSLPAATTIYTATSGAKVFAAGSIQWAYGLINHTFITFDPKNKTPWIAADPRIAQLMANILDAFSGRWDGQPRACRAPVQQYLVPPLQPTPTLVPPPGEAAILAGGGGSESTGASPAQSQPSPSPTPVAAQTVVPLNEDFSTGTLDQFTSSGTPGWQVVPRPIRDGRFSAFASAGTPDAESQLILAHSIPIPKQAVFATLQFVKGLQLGADATHFYAGMVLEISSNGGATWTDAAPHIVVGGYTDTITACCGNPLAGRSAWTGVTPSGGTLTQVNMLPYAGSSILIRWLIGSSQITKGIGAWLADINLTVGLSTAEKH